MTFSPLKIRCKQVVLTGRVKHGGNRGGRDCGPILVLVAPAKESRAVKAGRDVGWKGRRNSGVPVSATMRRDL